MNQKLEIKLLISLCLTVYFPSLSASLAMHEKEEVVNISRVGKINVCSQVKNNPMYPVKL